MKTKKMFSKVLAVALAALMLVGLMPVFASAADGDVDVGVDGLYLDKTATLEDDGTYTINLEAFSTGKTMTVLSQTPTDVVLVLDVSGSMEDNFDLVTGKAWTAVTDSNLSKPSDAYHLCPDGTYNLVTWSDDWSLSYGHRIRYTCTHCYATRKIDNPIGQSIPGPNDNDSWNLWRYANVTESKNKMLTLQEAAKAFLTGVAAKNAGIEDVSQQHRVALVKFASEDTLDTIGNETYGTNNYNYTQTVVGLTALNSENLGTMRDTVDALKPGGATAVDKGIEKAQGLLANSSSAGRNTVMIVFTDGDPTYSSSFQSAVAVSAITTAGTMKASGTVVYTVGVFTGANPADTETAATNKFLNAVSSNYKSATAVANGTSNITVTWNEGGNNGYYRTPDNTANLTDIFEEISTSIGTTSVTLTGEAVLKDVLNNGFVMTSDSTVAVKTAAYSGRNRDGIREFATPVASSLTASVSGNTITVSGFDYSSKYLVDGDSVNSNDFRPAKQGEKLIVTITGVEATDAAITDALVNTNSTVSGIYASASDANPAALFPVPKTQLSSRTYVLDYAKEVVLTDDLPNAVTHIDVDGMNKFDTAVPSVQMEYGLANGGSYTPTSMKWDGYDDYYAFGTWGSVPNGVTTGNNTWTKITVMPANNVYYEDTFVATNADNAGAGAGIYYDTTREDAWTIDGTASGNTETPNNEIHGGWISGDTGLSDDTGYSDGSAHLGSAEIVEGEDGTKTYNTATAKFSFTGTGFDIYSRTNGTTGTVLVQVTKDGTSQYMIVNCLAESGDYYQIPTVWFSGEYGTYDVEITVTAAAGEGRLNYYLDGIKIYNPMNTEEPNQTVTDAYGDELNATFMCVRDMLLHAESFDSAEIEDDPETEEDESKTVYPAEDVEGVVFIDRVFVGDTNGDSTGDPAHKGNELAVYTSYGPKNEVYLAPGNAIAFYIGVANKEIQVGLKSINDSVTAKALVSNADTAASIDLNHTTDLFYKVVSDANGFVVIRNGSTATTDTNTNPILSVTKLKFITNDAVDETAIAPASIDALLLAADEFDAMPVVAYSLRASAPETEEPTEPEIPVEPETPVEPEQPTEPSGPNVEIENPEEPTEPEQPDVEAIQEQIKQFVTSLFNAFRGWFGR